jgi:diguanylate cyclase (GGDEF)-like protein
MRWPLQRLVATVVLLAACALAAAQDGSAGAIVLRESTAGVAAADLAEVWVDARGEATVEQVSRPSAAASFQRARPAQVHELPPDAALWLHLRLQRAPGERQDWLLTFPMPVLDHVTVYQSEDDGWRPESAGDTLAVAQWPERGRYPFFRLDLPPGETRDVYVRIQHATPAHFPLQLVTAARHGERLQLEYLALGAAFGALLLLIVGCLAKAWVYRDAEFGWYAAYAGLTSLAVACFTGVASHLLWPGFGALQDAPTPMLASAAVGTAMLFVRNTLGLRRRLPLQDRLVSVLGIAGLVLALLPAFTPKAVHLQVIGTYVVAGTLAVLLVATLASWRGDVVGRWVLAAQLPMAVAVVATVLRTLGWADVPFVSQYVVILGLVLEVPLLLVALFMRSRDRHSAEVREQALSTHDALTGLLAPHLFHDRLRQVVARFRRDRQNAAVMYIDLVNHARIRDVYGTAVAEQSLLRTVIKLRRLLRDVDTIARVGEARFGVILEGATSRSSVTERATRLIAGGLMPLPGLKPEVTLQFHVAALLLSERPMEAEEMQAALDAQLGKMSRRTRRPIRFIDGEPPPTSEPGPESSLFADEDARAGDALA